MVFVIFAFFFLKMFVMMGNTSDFLFSCFISFPLLYFIIK